ncbi:MAG: Clp protease N-terminal domain-containing protein, partial [Clostridia bacterium]|nr:Clp protease N-terminal domain-containing protein [Clostridia bacterium]
MYNFTGFSEKANMCLNKAVEVAEDSGHTYIGSEHILLGLLDASDSVAGKILANRGVTYKKVFDLIRETVGVGMPTE